MSTEPRGVRLAEDGAMIDMPAAEALAAARDRGCPLIILARTHETSMSWAREHGVPISRAVHATRQSVRGYTNSEIVVLPGFHDRPDAEKIWEALLPGLLVGQRYPRWAGTEPQEVDPELDDLTRAQLDEVSQPAGAVCRALDRWLRSHYDILPSSRHRVGDFLDLLAAEGFRVEPIEAPDFAAVLPAPVE